jgi:molybdate transport system ATP-binding protein
MFSQDAAPARLCHAARALPPAEPTSAVELSGLSVDVRVRPAPGRGPTIAARFQAPPGITGLFGPSGVGKTTLMLAVAGLVTPETGRIALAGRSLFDAGVKERRVNLPPERRRVALVFQSLALFPHMTALDNVLYGIPRSRPAEARREAARGWLQRMRVEHVSARRPDTFSGGEAQRVAIARALASHPEALLLDEPLSALDEALRRELSEELAAIVAERPLPLILVTHDRRELERLASDVVVLPSPLSEPARQR